MKKKLLTLAFVSFSLLTTLTTSNACTHITLKGADGTIVIARTMEWETFDLNMNFNVIPRNTEFKSFERIAFHGSNSHKRVTSKGRIG